MRIRTPLLVTTAAATMLVGAALPALATGSGTPTVIGQGTTGGPTVTTFTLTGGPMTVTIDPAATLTGAAPGAASVTGTLGPVAVSDARGSTAGWVVSGASTSFTGAGDPSTGVSYSAGTVTPGGAVSATSAGATPLGTVALAVVNGTAANGDNTASWIPDLTVTLPTTALAGAYTGTVTTSIN